MVLEVKFATRMDSPGCLDTFDPNITIQEDRFVMAISCRSDKMTYRYELNLELFGNVDVNTSYFELGSVGRLYANFTKADHPSRWRRLLKQQEKMPNMQLWWEIHERYEDKLLSHTQFETDEDFMEGMIHVERPKRKKAPKVKKVHAHQGSPPSEAESKVRIVEGNCCYSKERRTLRSARQREASGTTHPSRGFLDSLCFEC